MMQASRVFPWLVAAGLVGCTGTGEVEYGGEVNVASPDLVMVSPGVEVVSDADEPVFYVDGSYYLYRDNIWLRSDDYRRGFVRIDSVPGRLRDIREPRAYVHYRQGNKAAARMPAPPPRQAQPMRTEPREQPREPQRHEPARPAEPVRPAAEPPRAREQAPRTTPPRDQRDDKKRD